MPSREDYAIGFVTHRDRLFAERDLESSITDWSNAKECVCKTRHVMPHVREVIRYIGDGMHGSGRRVLGLASFSANCDGKHT